MRSCGTFRETVRRRTSCSWTHSITLRLHEYSWVMRILVVEDNDLVADAITMGLSAAGFAVDRSASSEAAHTALATEHFDLLVVDVGLPGEDGLSLVRNLRARG